jgi:LmbE family N-acetylglucosaminyl deacetylase
MEKYLFIGAHPDDIEFGAGATLAKAVEANIDCHALVLSDCHESLESFVTDPKTLVHESKRALKALGVDDEKVTFLTFPVRNFPKKRQEILQSLIEKARICNYTRIFNLKKLQ